MDWHHNAGSWGEDLVVVEERDGFAEQSGYSNQMSTGKLEHTKPIQVEDFKFLESRIAAQNGITATTKVCIPSPTMVHFRGKFRAFLPWVYDSCSNQNSNQAAELR
jgi:methionine synthase II (cobalamin-independent)